jgi:hypothetical protein
MFFEDIRKGLIGQFLKRRHPIACKLGELVERVVIEGDQFAQACRLQASDGWSSNPRRRKSFRSEQGLATVVTPQRSFPMKKACAAAVLAAIAVLIFPAASSAQNSSGPSAGSNSAAGSPNAGSAGAGTSSISGVPSGPASLGGLNNAGEDPSGAANSSKLASPPGTNSAGTAQSSGAGVNSGAGVTTGSAGALGTGTAATPNTSSDAAINEENKTVDHKLKGICRGC